MFIQRRDKNPARFRKTFELDNQRFINLVNKKMEYQFDNICCGLDVHKDSVYCAVHEGSRNVKVYATFTSTLRQMGKDLEAQGVKSIAMESTGSYWIPVWNVLEEFGFELLLVNPYHIKQMPGRKSDVKDAQWIAELLHKKMLRGSMVPDGLIRELRTYSRRYVGLQGQKTKVLQEIERTMEMMNIRISSLSSKIESKSVMKVVDALLEGVTDPKELEKLIHGRIRNRHQDNIRLSLDGKISKHHLIILKQYRQQHQMYLEQEVELEQSMHLLAETYFSEQISNLKTIAGISDQAAIQIVAETSGNMKPFSKSGKLSGWAGLRPRNDESAGKIKSKAICKGNKYLRRIMVQVAWAASRTKGSDFQAFFNRVSLRIGRKKALIALARKMLTIVWNVLDKGQSFDQSIRPEVSKEKKEKQIKALEQKLKTLKELYQVD